MTTQTPTGDVPGGVTLTAPSAGPLPDAATLARWANELFSAVPGAPSPAQLGASLPSASLPSASLPSVPLPGASLPGVPLPGASLPSVPLPGVPSVPAIPAPAGLPAYDAPGFEGLAALVNAALPRLGAQDLTHPALPPVPLAGRRGAPATGIPGSVAAAVPTFYFLQDQGVPALPRGYGHPAFDVPSIRRDFPILATRVHGRPLVWFDNAATTQKPNAVIDRLSYFYQNENSNIHRAAHELAARATDAYEGARRQVQRFLGAASADEIVFVRGATEAINLVAQSWGRKHISAGDEILVSHLEHHANIVPWQMLALERGAELRVVPVDSSGQLRLDEFQRLLTDRTKIVSIAHVSNALGTVTPVQEVIELAHRAGATVLIDGAQSVSHMPIDVKALGADFFVLSGHKVFGPTGIGVLYGRQSVLEDMPPWQGGGNMIEDVTFERSLYQRPPTRFEAGTGNIADAVGLGAALEYLTTIGMPNIERYEAQLLSYATEQILTVPGLEIVGTAAHKASVLSFVVDGLEPTAIGSALNQEGIAVRAGHHCAQPILRRFGHESTVRASLALYNTHEEVDALVCALHQLAASPTKAYR
jgi:cysteine desulfurase/selenocysteine lyase